MRAWVIKTSEMLATDNGNGRLLRSGLVAHMLDARGHDVTWWVSTFDHANRRQRHDRSVTGHFGKGGTLRMLYSPGYRTVLSPRRLVDHAIWGRAFARELRQASPPDIIFCAYPTIESAWLAVRYGKRHAVPVVLDLRDMWPDIITSVAPAALRPVARIALSPLYAMARSACSDATALFGITEEFVNWGLGYAGRPRNELDAAFPLAYPRSEFTTADAQPAADAQRYWDELGVTRDSAFNVVLVGSLNGRRYEMGSVIEAARRLREERSPVRVLICGDGENLPAYRKLASDCPNVIFPGWLKAPLIRALLPRAHLGLVPYRNTPDFMISVPNKAVEYLSAGVPVATSLRGTLPRVLAENGCGVQFDAARPGTLVDQIRALRDDPQRQREQAQRASALFEREFVAEDVYARLADRLEAIAEMHAARRSAVPANRGETGSPYSATLQQMSPRTRVKP